MRTGWKRSSVKVICSLLILAGFFYCLETGLKATNDICAAERVGHMKTAKYRILYIMSYHSPWEWTDEQLAGFKKAFAKVAVEYNSFQLDTKRQSSSEWKEQIGQKARQLIESWKPDLVYTSDDNAQQLVTRYYVNHKIPFVFSAVNSEPVMYGLVPSKNIAGVMEQEHYVETVKLLLQLKPGIKRLAIITDDDPTWKELQGRIAAVTVNALPNIELVSYDVLYTFRDYQARLKEYQTKVDAVGLFGIHTFKDTNGNNVPWQEVLKWTVFNSNLPDFSFYKERIEYGTLCSVNVCGFEQGYAAGKIARGILVDGKSPDSFPIRSTGKGKPIISLARAKRLGLEVKTKLLLSTRVINKFAWEN